MARKGFNRNQPRDANGRFASGGGSSGGKSTRAGSSGSTSRAGSSGGRKRNKSFVTTTGTFLTRGRAKLAQRRRTRQFSSKAAPTAAKLAYKAAARGARIAEKRAAAGKGARATVASVRKRAGVNGADLARRFERLSASGPLGSAALTKRERQLRAETDPAKRKILQRKLDRARRTQARALGFRNAVAGVQGMGYRRVSSTPEGQATIAVNYSRRPRYSTRQRIVPAWNKQFL